MSQLTDYLNEGDLGEAVCEECGVTHNPRKRTEPTMYFVIYTDDSTDILCNTCIADLDQDRIKELFTAKTDY